MTVIRKARKKNNFVILDKEALWNPLLSNKAIGLWARCMSRPDDWIFHVKELETKIKESKKAIYSSLAELIKHRYVLVVRACLRDKGKFIDQIHEYIFFEGPATNEQIDEEINEFKKKYSEIYWEIGDLKKSFRLRRFGKARNGLFRKEQLLSNDNTKEKEGTKKELDECHSAVPSSSDEEKASLLNLCQKLNLPFSLPFLTKLIKKYGIKRTKENIDLYIQESKKKRLDKPEGWLYKACEHNFYQKNAWKKTNAAWVEGFIKEKGWNNIIMTKSYIKIKNTQKEVYYNIDPIQFSLLMNLYYTQDMER